MKKILKWALIATVGAIIGYVTPSEWWEAYDNNRNTL